MPKPKDTRERLRATGQAAAAAWDKRAEDAQRLADEERERRQQERFSRAEQALEVVASPYGARPQLAAMAEPHPEVERRSPGELRSESEPRSEMATIAVQVEPGSPAEPRSAGELRSARARVNWKDGELRIPNYIVDNLLPMLTQDEATIYLRLYRLAQYVESGRPRGWCVIGAPKLVETTKIKRTAAFAALKGLEAKGLIRRDAQEILRGENGGRGSQGNRYRVFEPEVEGRPATEPRSGYERRSRSEPRSAGGRMKVHESKDMKEPDAVAPANILSILRTEAEEYRTHYPGANEDVVRARLRELVKREGWHVNEATIQAAAAMPEVDPL